MPWRRISRFRWTFIGTLIVLFVLAELARYRIIPLLDSSTGQLLFDLVILGGAIFVFGGGFQLLDTMQRRLDRQSRELAEFHRAVGEVYRAVSPNAVLRKVVEQAVGLLDGRYGVLVLADELHQVTHLVTTGLTAEQREEMGIGTGGRGLVAAALASDRPMRLSDLEAGSSGALLVVPLDCKETSRGRLLVGDRTHGGEFRERDEETLVRFARAAAFAVDNAQLHERLRSLAVAEERERIGGEIHDGIAQVLAYVNAKAQAVSGYLTHDRPEQAAAQLEQLATAAREAYTDAREAILALRTQPRPGRPFRETLEEFVTVWESQSAIPAELLWEGEVELDPMVELQLLRIVQEALANVRKHSGADRVAVEVTQESERLRVVVADDGSGFDPAAHERRGFPRFGLSIMRERAETVGGRLRIDSSPREGTRVTMEVPLEGQDLSGQALAERPEETTRLARDREGGR